MSDDDAALIAELNDDPSPASEALIEIVLRVHRRYREIFSASGVAARFKREFRIKSYLLDGWQTYARSLLAPRAPAVAADTAGTIEALLEEFETACDPLLFNNLVLAHQIARGGSITSSIRTELEALGDAFAGFASGRLSHRDFVRRFGHHSLRPYELAEPRFHESDDSTLRRIASMVTRKASSPKRELAEFLPSKNPASPDILVSVREIARSEMLRTVDALRQRLLAAAFEAHIDDVFAQPISETLAQTRAR